MNIMHRQLHSTSPVSHESCQWKTSAACHDTESNHSDKARRQGSHLFFPALFALLCCAPELQGAESRFFNLSDPTVMVLTAIVVFLAFLVLKYYLKCKFLLRTQKAVARLPVQCGVCDEKGHIFFYKDNNEARADIDPKTIKDLPIELQQELENVLPVVFKSNSRKTIEFDSFTTRYKIDITPLPRKDYGVPTILWVVHDITDLTNAFAERTQTVQLLQNTLRSIGDAVISTNYDGEITLANRSACEMSAMSEKELEGKQFDEIFHFRDDQGGSLISKAILTDTNINFHSELNIRNREPMFVDGLIAPIIDDQIIVGTVLYFRDTTELTRQEQKLQLALKFAQTTNRAKSDFLATVNHEFRSSVNVIIGYCDLSSVNNQGVIDPIIENIHREAEKLLLMFNDILDVSLNNTDTMGITLGPVNLRELSSEIQRIFGWTSGNKKAPLIVQMEQNVPIIISDYKALRQILMQLLSQAYSMVAGQDAVRLSIIWFNQDLVIAIVIKSQKMQIQQDRNIGIFKRLCERLNGTLSFKQKDDSIVLEVVLNHPKVVSETPTLTLPDLSNRKTKPHRDVVLLVDDIAINLKVLGTMLKKMNIDSVPCTSAQAALEEIDKYTPLAIFTDLWMPDIGGKELAHILQKNPETASIPRILITADTQLDKNIEELFQCIVYKPLKPQTLQNMWNILEQRNNKAILE